jgi:drug/metabolite transporter (DMT)-like permease
MTSLSQSKLPRGVAAALLAALLFGAGTPAAKLLAATSPWLLAALLYLGSGLGLAAWRRLRRAPAVRLAPGEWRWLAGAVLAGGVVGPVLLMVGLNGLAASTASLLLNAEGVFTALLAWTVFRENVDRRVALGMAAIVAGGVVLSWPGQVAAVAWLPALAVTGACAAWAVDNNLTRKLSLNDASWLAMVKGLAAGATNLVLALALGAHWPALPVVTAAALLGFASYGASLMLFVVALRELGTGRTGAYFSVAPFFGALLAIVLLGDAVTPQLLAAGVLMAIGVGLHLSERHQHAHRHEPLAHSHAHYPDAHHRHPHPHQA